MPNFEMLVTDVTRYGTRFCVAGWDLQRHEMVRPEPPGAVAAYEASRFWENNIAGPGQVLAVGNVVRFEASAPPQNFAFPHATEDKAVPAGSNITVIARVDLAAIPARVAAGVSNRVAAAFDGGLVRLQNGKASVPRDFRGRSLGAVEVDPKALTFFENSFGNKPTKLRALIQEGGAAYDLGVTADAAVARWSAGGLKGLNADVAASRRVHVRVGLSRPFAARPDDCFVQINGLILL
jgi:hypothetical protein